MIDYHRVLGRLRCLRPNPKIPRSWFACCPVHKNGEERRPSLAAWIKHDGNCFFCKCYACGARTIDVVKALGFTMRDLQDKPTRPLPDATDEQVEKRKVVAEYVYQSRHGNPLYRVCRWQPKGFHQERYDPMETGKTNWRSGLADVERVLYRLPELLAKPEQPVIVVEGEKDADRIASLGLIGTTCVGGSGMGWRDDYSLDLIGRRVAILPDNDGPGLRHAYHVAGSLLAHHVASVRIVFVPQGWKDVSEWLDAGHDKDHLLALLKAAMHWTPSDQDFEATRYFLRDAKRPAA